MSAHDPVMGPIEDRSMLEDLWIQVLLIFTFIAGLFCVNFFLDSWSVHMNAGPVQNDAANRRVNAGTRERIVEADAPNGSPLSLSAALASAVDGDEIALKPGTYRESIAISKSITLSGVGFSAQDVVLAGDGERVVAVSGGRATIRHLTIVGSASEAVAVGVGSLALLDARVRAQGVAVRVVDGDLELGDSQLRGRTALSVEGRSRVRVLRSRIGGEDTAVSASGLGVELRFENADLSGDVGSAIDASRFAKIHIDDSTLSRNGQSAVRVASGAELSVIVSTIGENGGCAVVVDRGIVFLDRVRVSRSECGVGFDGPGSLRVMDSAFAELRGAALRLRRGFEKDVSVSGEDNTGIDLRHPSR